MTLNSVFFHVVRFVAIVPAIVLHEVAHGYVAWRLGDPTARDRGRLTLNPIAHIDLFGTILLPILLLVLRTGFVFGYAKPVPINPSFFRNRSRGMLWVAAAGPLTNALLAAATTLLGRLVLLVVDPSFLLQTSMAAGLLRTVIALLYFFVVWNLVLALLNLIPIPPLDGSRILAHFLPAEGRRAMASIERYGFFLLIALLALGVLDRMFLFVVGGWDSLLGPRWQAVLIEWLRTLGL